MSVDAVARSAAQQPKADVLMNNGYVRQKKVQLPGQADIEIRFDDREEVLGRQKQNILVKEAFMMKMAALKQSGSKTTLLKRS